MTKFFFNIAIVLFFLFFGFKTTAQIKLHTEDLPRFYEAFDSVMTTTDNLKQTEFIQKLYVDKASGGLKVFMQLREINALELQKMIQNNKQKLIEKRPWILSVLKQQPVIEQKIERFKQLYPDFRDGDIYFCVGKNNSGGTIEDKTVFIGAEVLASNQENWAISTVLHEFTHTQQWTQRNINRLKSSEVLIKEYMGSHADLLGRCLEEGIADFMAELSYGENLAVTNPSGHTAFGLKNEQEIWRSFQKEMFLKFDGNGGWLYGKREFNGQKVSDLGYFVGHQICKSYYNKAKNKKQALKQMLELNVTDEAAQQFLMSSGYISKKETEKIKQLYKDSQTK